jgi:Helix-turn-helix domain
MTSDQLTAPARDPLLNSAEAAAYLNVPMSTLRNQRRAWGLEPFRVGRALQYRESELRAYLESRRESSHRRDQIPA